MNDSSPESLQLIEAVTPPSQRRRRWLLLFGGVALLAGIGVGVWELFFAGNTVETDNAYTAAEVAQITPLVAGPVKQVKVVDSQMVHTGDVLIVLDDTDAQIALTQAEANLARTKRQIRQIMANDVNLAAQINLRSAEREAAEAELTRARATLEKALLDAKRRRNLVEEGGVSRQDLTDAETRLREAEAEVRQTQARVEVSRAANAAAGGARQANAALIADSTVENHP